MYENWLLRIIFELTSGKVTVGASLGRQGIDRSVKIKVIIRKMGCGMV
jgi:hypothetical protein